MVCFLLLQARAAAQIKWDELGTKSVDRTLDRDVIQVKNEEIYKALKIKVEQGMVNVYKTTIHFRGGETQDVNMPEVLTTEDKGLIDLNDNTKVIDRITFWYDTKGSKEEKAVIKIWARK